jgi:hypothetical protein
MTEAKREVIDFMENGEVYGRYFSGKLLRKNRSIKRMRENRRKLQAERGKLTIRSAKGGETGKICRLKVETANPKALTSLCANIRVHRDMYTALLKRKTNTWALEGAYLCTILN